MITWLLAACVATIPLGTRLFIGSAIPGVHEYEAIFFYASDILLILFVVFAWRVAEAQIRSIFHAHGSALMFVLCISGLASTVVAPSFWLSIYALARLVLVIIFAYSIGALANRQRLLHVIVATLALMSVLQAGIGIAQFRQQESIGLTRFGEPLLVSYTGAASTVPVDGGRFLRVYGTFPHPNIFAAFLVLGLLSLAYWYLWCEQKLSADLFKHPRSWWTLPHTLGILNDYLTHRYFFLRLAVVASTFLVVVGLALSFSRSGWIGATTGLLALLAMLAARRYMLGGLLRLALMLAACSVATYLLFVPLIAPRAHLSRAEKAVDERVTYMMMGAELAEERIGGVGAGNQVLYSVEHGMYQQYGLKNVWHWEPIHNLYLLVLSEIGWLGLLSFLVFLGMVTWRLVRQPASIETALAFSLLVALLVVGLFDHFLWTLQPGRLMLWLAIGLALSQLPLGKRTRS